jgi:hypothetical protein
VTWRTHATRLLGVAVVACGLVALAYRRPFSYRIDVGADDASYIEGFQDRQRQGDVDWRWSEGWARLHFHNAGQLVTQPRLRVRLGALGQAEPAAATVSLALNERPVAAFAAPSAMTLRQFPIDADGLGSGDWVLSVSKAAAERRGERQLALRVDWAELSSRAGPRLPPLRTTTLCGLCALAAYLALARGPRPSRSLAASLTAAGLLAGGLAWAREPTVALLPGLCAALWAVAASSAICAAGLLARLRSLAGPHEAAWLGFGIGLALAGQTLLSKGALTAGAALLLLGVLALVATSLELGVPDGALAVPHERWLAAAVLGLALLFRLFRLDEVPFAIFRDEARHGLVALEMLARGSLPPLFLGPPINQPSPYFLALAAAFERLGPGLDSLRIVSALAGAAVAPLTWRLMREIAGPRVALVAALGVAASSWHVSISRFAVNYVEPTLLTVPACLFWLRAARRGRLTDFALCGLAAGAAQYASHTAKAVFIVLAAAAADEALRRYRAGDGTATRRLWVGCALAAVLCLVVLAPILREFQRGPEAYTARMRQVSILEDANAQALYPLERLTSGLTAYLGAFNVQGDLNGRHHMPGAPLFDPVSAACLAVGSTLLLAGLGDHHLRFLLYWAAGSLVPGLLTVDPPTATRIVEAAPALYGVAALGAVGCWRRASALGVARPVRRVVAGALIATTVACNGWLYFVAMYRSPAVWVKLAPVATQLGRRLDAMAAAGRLASDRVLYAPDRFIEHPDELLVMHFLSPRIQVRSFENADFAPRRGDLLVLPNYCDLWRRAASQAPRDVAESQTAEADLARWQARLATLPASPTETGPPFPGTSDPTFWLYVLDAPRGSGETAATPVI